MLESVLYVFVDKNEDKNIVIQTEDDLICINPNDDKMKFFNNCSDLFEFVCDEINFKENTLSVNENFKKYHIEIVEENLGFLEKSTIFHLLNDVTYE